MSILINFPTNIGDTILGLPVLDRVKANYPYASITAIASSKTKDLLSRNNFIDNVVVFDKQWGIFKKAKFVLGLRRQKYDLIIDLKNSFLPVMLGIRKRTPFFRKFSKNTHIKEKYLSLVRNLIKQEADAKSVFILSEGEIKKLDNFKIRPSIFVACSSRSSLKCYPYKFLKEVIECLRVDYSLVVIGEEQEHAFYKDILFMKGVTDLVGKTKLYEIPYLLKNYARLLLCVDSSMLHLASYLDLPIVAIFGPTSVERSKPYSRKSIVLSSNHLTCVPCEKSECQLYHECMNIPPIKIISAVREMIT